MTSEKKDCNPSDTSEVVGDTSENLNTSYSFTENNPAPLQEHMDQPKFLNPGSIESNDISVEETDSVFKVVDSIKAYLNETKKSFNDIMLYMTPIAFHHTNVLGPAIFAEDVRVVGDTYQIKCFSRIDDFLTVWLRRKRRFVSAGYPQECIGVSYDIADRNLDGYVDWKFNLKPLLIYERSKHIY